MAQRSSPGLGVRSVNLPYPLRGCATPVRPGRPGRPAEQADQIGGQSFVDRPLRPSAKARKPLDLGLGGPRQPSAKGRVISGNLIQTSHAPLESTRRTSVNASSRLPRQTERQTPSRSARLGGDIYYLSPRSAGCYTLVGSARPPIDPLGVGPGKEQSERLAPGASGSVDPVSI